MNYRSKISFGTSCVFVLFALYLMFFHKPEYKVSEEDLAKGQANAVAMESMLKFCDTRGGIKDFVVDDCTRDVRPSKKQCMAGPPVIMCGNGENQRWATYDLVIK